MKSLSPNNAYTLFSTLCSSSRLAHWHADLWLYCFCHCWIIYLLFVIFPFLSVCPSCCLLLYLLFYFIFSARYCFHKHVPCTLTILSHSRSCLHHFSGLWQQHWIISVWCSLESYPQCFLPILRSNRYSIFGVKLFLASWASFFENPKTGLVAINMKKLLPKFACIRWWDLVTTYINLFKKRLATLVYQLPLNNYIYSIAWNGCI